MKEINIALCAIICSLAVCFVGMVDSSALIQNHHRVFGAEKCTWGPTYWCNNITNAKGCNAVRHCIQTVWENHNVPVDNDSICQICKDMVKQARDQLNSNETLEELKEVFEGSCNLIPIKIVKKECCNLADNFIPELVETLSSQMNPDQVCSVAGLCNNAEIDRLIMKHNSSHEATTTPVLSCDNCYNLATLITDKFQSTNRDDVLANILDVCGGMSSFSDACASIALTYFNDIYNHIQKTLVPSGICHVSGVCAIKYHKHADNLKKGEQSIDLTVAGNDDIPCQLCEQLVRHLRDVLVANTTENEFKQVLESLCNQTKDFRPECLSIVDQYYDIIYKALVNDLDANGACFLIGVCPKTSNLLLHGEIRPLLPVLPQVELNVTIMKLGPEEPKFTKEVIESMQLPIDSLLAGANPNHNVENGELCAFCEYLLHFVQESLATPSTEDEIKQAVNGICNKLPIALKGQCHDFVDMYGEAFIALLIQGLDPNTICPKMQMCPRYEQDKPTCPLCLFAVDEAQMKILNDKSKENIKNVLDHLCDHLPQKLQPECVDFVQTYSSELIDMLITDFKPQEICVALRLCPKPNNFLYELGISLGNEIEGDKYLTFNEVDDDMPVEISYQKHNDEGISPNCVLCLEVIKLAEKRLNKHMTKEDIKNALENSCIKLRKNLQPKCHKYVNKYGDKIAELLLKEMEPKFICTEVGLCSFIEHEDLEIDEALKYDVIAVPNKSDRFVRTDEATIFHDSPSCVLCEFIMEKLEIRLKNKTEQEEIKRTVRNICHHMPNTVSKSCDKFVEQYASAIIALLGSVPPKEICQKLQACFYVEKQLITDEVVKCGVCHAASASLLPYLRKYTEHDKINDIDMMDVGCEQLPSKFYQTCAEMIGIYGKSIKNLSVRLGLDASRVCYNIGKCLRNEDSALAFARISA